MRSGGTFARSLAGLVLVVSLLNGTPFLLARIGWIDPSGYQSDRQRFCPSQAPPRQMVSACSPVKPAPALADGVERLNLSRLHTPSGAWNLLKAGRLLPLLGLPIASLLAMALGRWPWPTPAAIVPVLPLLVSSSVALAQSLAQAPLPAVLQGLGSLAWLPLLLLAGAASQPAVLVKLAQAMGLLILLQWPWMLVEAIWGLPMSFGPPADQLAQASLGLPTRLVGSFILPNSLGVAMVALLGFCMAYLPGRRAPAVLAILALPPLLLARSGTGLLSWAIVMAVWVSSIWRPHAPSTRLSLKLLGLLLLGAVALRLPHLLGRADLWQSLGGRLGALNSALGSSSPWQWWFGQGLVTNKPTDSLPTLLILQGGLLALLAFYGLLVWAWQRDREARPFLLAVSLGSLTLPITELFPINLLLALCLHATLKAQAPQPPSL